VDTFEGEEEIDVAAVEQEIEQLESELVDVRKKMKPYLKELVISAASGRKTSGGSPSSTWSACFQKPRSQVAIDLISSAS